MADATILAYAQQLQPYDEDEIDVVVRIATRRFDRLPTVHQMLEVRREMIGETYSPAPVLGSGPNNITFLDYRKVRPDMAERWDAIPGRTPWTEGQVWDWDTAMDDAAEHGWGRGGPRGWRPKARVEPEATP